MNKCPKCSQAIEDAFGIMQCPKCEVLLVADFEGNLKLSAEGAVEVTELPEAPFSVSQASGKFEQPDIMAEPEKIVDAELNEWNFDSAEADPPASDQVMAVNSGNAVESIEPLEPVAEAISEINRFANSEDSHAREGIFFYQLKISGIDSADLRTAVKDCLDDSKLKLNTGELVKSMRDGILLIPKLNAVKASVIVTRLKEYPLELEWSQMSLISSGANSNAN